MKWTFGTLITLLLLAWLAVVIFLDGIVKNYLIESTSKNSNGLYRLEIRDLNISLWNSRIDIEGVKLFADENKWQELKDDSTKSVPSKIEFNIPSVEITDITWFDFIKSRKLSIDTILVSTPKIGYDIDLLQRVAQNENMKEIMYNAVSAFSDDFTVKRIILKEAKVDLAIYNDDLELHKHLENMRIRFDDIAVNKANLKNRHKIFFSENIHFNLERLDLLLQDQSTLVLNNIGLSTSDSTLTFEDVRFNKKDSLNIRIQNVVVNEIQVRELIENNNIIINKILLHQPYLKQKKEKEFKVFTMELRDKIEGALSSIGNRIEIDTFQITQANVDIEKRDPHQNYLQFDQFKNVDILFKHIHFDRDSSETDEHLLYANHLKFKAKQISSTREDSSFYASIDHVNFTTVDSNLSFHDIVFFQANKLDAKLPQINLYLPNWKRYWDNGIVEVENIDVLGPIIKYDIKPVRYDSTKKTISEVISTFCTGLEVRHLDVQEGNLKRSAYSKKGDKTWLSANSIYLSLNNISITPGMSEKKTNEELFSDLEDIRARNFEFTSGNDISVSALRLRTSGHHQNVMINKFVFDKGDRIALTMDTLNVHGIAWEKFWQEPEHIISIKQIELNKPEIYFRTFGKDTLIFQDAEALSLKKMLPTLIKPFSDRLEVSEINIRNGKFHHNIVHQHHKIHELQRINNLNLNLQNLIVQSDTLIVSPFLFSNNMDMDIQNYKFKLPDSDASIQFQRFTSSTKDSIIKVKNVVFSKGKEVRIDIPEIVIDKIGWTQYWKDNSLAINVMSINDPIINLVGKDGKTHVDTTQKFRARDLDELLPKIIGKFSNLLTIEQLLVDNGQFNSTLKVRGREIIQRAEQVKITFDKLRIDSSSIKNAGQFLFSNNVQLRLNNYKFIPDDSLYTIEAKWLEANSIDSSIAFRDIYFTKDSTLKVDLDLLTFHSMSIQNYIRTNRLHMSRLDMDSINIIYHLYDTPLDSTAKKNAFRSVDEIIESLAYSLDIDEITIDKKAPGNISFISDNFIQSFKNFTLQIDKVNIDTSYSYNINELPFAKSIVFEAQSYVNDPKDSLDYRIVTGPIQLSTKSKTASIASFKMTPLRSEEDFMRSLKYREPRYELSTSTIIGKNFNFIRLFNEGEIAVKKVEISAPNFKVFEDKNIPRDSSKFPQMPNDIFKKLSFLIDFENIDMRNAYIEYQQREAGETEIGIINFTQKGNDYISMLNITNDPEKMTFNSPAYLDAHAHFMDTGQVSLKMSIPLLSEQLICYYDFFLGEMNAHHINKFVTGTANLELKKGKIIRIENVGSPVIINDSICTGEMKAVYNNFKIRLFEKGTKAKRRFVTFIGNLILSSTNKKDQAIISYDRDPYDSFVKFVWQGIKSGLERTMLPGFLQTKKK